jgi:hypothetical protein
MVRPVVERVVIERRFNGPPDSGNGGYTCGLLAREIDGPAEVTLRKPPPLGVDLRLAAHGGRVELRHGEELVAEAEPIAVDRFVEPPGTVPRAEAHAAAARSTYLDDGTHPFPTCFVCGPLRDAGDGLRIFPGRLDGRDLFACPWTPDEGDHVPVEIVWAALDCPTSAPLMNAPGPDGKVLPIVLARLAVEVRGAIRAGTEHVITSWEIGREGRKREAGAALYGAGDDKPLAVARALWIELRAAD